MEGASELEGMAMDGMWPTASVGTGGDVFPHVTGFLLLRIRWWRFVAHYHDISR